jgi:hypothetical protein
MMKNFLGHCISGVPGRGQALKLLDGDIHVGVDADSCGDL